MNQVFIQGKFPTANEYIDACRRNRYQAAKMKRDAEQLVMLQARRLSPIKQRVRIRFVWHEANRKRDPDNVAFAKKFILDALQRIGKLKNDNAQFIAGFEDWFTYGEGQGVFVEVIPVEC